MFKRILVFPTVRNHSFNVLKTELGLLSVQWMFVIFFNPGKRASLLSCCFVVYQTNNNNKKDFVQQFGCLQNPSLAFQFGKATELQLSLGNTSAVAALPSNIPITHLFIPLKKSSSSWVSHYAGEDLTCQNRQPCFCLWGVGCQKLLKSRSINSNRIQFNHQLWISFHRFIMHDKDLKKGPINSSWAFVVSLQRDS